MSTHYQIQEGVAILAIHNPPVNGLGLATRRGLLQCLERALDDSQVKAIVVTGSARAFSAGADIREFNQPQASQEPTLRTVIVACERSSKPVVAAIEGMALGGGLELALGMHYRVADARAQIGLPEVKLGILPGAGGTQRLPRAVGLELASHMMISGMFTRAEQLATTRLFDRVVQSDVLTAACTLALTSARCAKPLPRVRDWHITHPDADGFLESIRQGINMRSAYTRAQCQCLEAITVAVHKPFDQGLNIERACFDLLVNTPESKALRHAFFAERAARKK